MDLAHHLQQSAERTSNLTKQKPVHPEDQPDIRMNAFPFILASRDTHILGSPKHGQACGD
jgi:hypothetical protein